ncbi:MAG: HPr family phosphocarrier protein [Eubacterium sp.]|nr:HPr family phosphocarrier protein [Eubacterium sp.]
MIRKNIDVSVEKEGARPIAMLVQEASKYKSQINICQGNKTVNAKSIMGMMTLGLVSGQPLEILVDGEDEEAAMANIEEFLLGK